MPFPGTDLSPLSNQLPCAPTFTITAARIEAETGGGGGGRPAGKSFLLFSLHWQLGLDVCLSLFTYRFVHSSGKGRLYCSNNLLLLNCRTLEVGRYISEPGKVPCYKSCKGLKNASQTIRHKLCILNSCRHVRTQARALRPQNVDWNRGWGSAEWWSDGLSAAGKGKCVSVVVGWQLEADSKDSPHQSDHRKPAPFSWQRLGLQPTDWSSPCMCEHTHSVNRHLYVHIFLHTCKLTTTLIRKGGVPLCRDCCSVF